MAYPTYRDMNKDIASCHSNVAAQSMLQAVHELRDNYNISVYYIVDTSVSCDGTWQKRGYASLNGVVTVISVDT